MNWLAFDIGGANLKMADGRGFAVHHAFALWKDPQKLASELRIMIAEAPQCDRIVVTMTGELADCFETKSEGVRAILQAVDEAADGRHTRVYLTNGRLVAPGVAMRDPLRAAAANWRALAAFATRFAPSGPALLLDIGSTTTDIIPLRDGTVVARGATDTERLLSHELVYAGVERTPVCSVVPTVPYRGELCPVMREVFATTIDVYLLTGDLTPNPANTNTADQRGATKAAARTRISRMIGAPEEEFNHRDAVEIAKHVAQQQVELLAASIEQVANRLGDVPRHAVVAGQGEFLAPLLFSKLGWSTQTPKIRILPLSQKIGQQASRAAPAHALAVLAREAVQGT